MILLSVGTYKSQQTVRSKLFNYKKFSESFDIYFFTQNQTIPTCHCENLPFIDPEHGHFLAGDLRFVRNNKLRKLINKGPTYR